MTENEIGIKIKLLEKKAFYRRIKSHFVGIVTSVCLIIITTILYCFYPKIESYKRLLFLFGSIWPSLAVAIFVPICTIFIRDMTENIGYDIYTLLLEDVSKKFRDSPSEGDFLRFLEDRRNALQSVDKTTRRKTLKEILENINE
jgi:hypothetical protein